MRLGKTSLQAIETMNPSLIMTHNTPFVVLFLLCALWWIRGHWQEVTLHISFKRRPDD